MKKRYTLLTVIIACLGFSAAPALAAWPDDKPIVVVVPYGAGGSSDLIGRTIAEQLQNQLGVSVVVENRPGAGGTLGASQVARAVPDGYRILLANTAHTAAPALFDNLDYDFSQGMTHIVKFAAVPNIIILNKESKVNDMKGFIEYLKAENTDINYGTPGIGTTNHLAVEVLNSYLKTDPRHIPYGGAGPIFIDLIAGRLDFTVQSTPASASHLDSQSVKPVAVTSKQRMKKYPDLPTVAEFLGEDYEIVTWYGLSGPKGMPQEVTEKISEAVKKALSDPKLSQLLQSMDADVSHVGPEGYSAFVEAESKKWKALNLKAG